eukprot:TRINITY_DN98049_c0_g1_i1.p1 TRINITY_DN98049_c0_g1~~TRINITY_DN98049_c0_g1_i1.p1  ORF type:complete len:254 (+),score=61.00 TRINITY_DN98049_c0_g1_i1:32-793(+)
MYEPQLPVLTIHVPRRNNTKKIENPVKEAKKNAVVKLAPLPGEKSTLSGHYSHKIRQLEYQLEVAEQERQLELIAQQPDPQIEAEKQRVLAIEQNEREAEERVLIDAFKEERKKQQAEEEAVQQQLLKEAEENPPPPLTEAAQLRQELEKHPDWLVYSQRDLKSTLQGWNDEIAELENPNYLAEERGRAKKKRQDAQIQHLERVQNDPAAAWNWKKQMKVWAIQSVVRKTYLQRLENELAELEEEGGSQQAST